MTTISLERRQELLRLYLNNMKEIRRRTESIDKILLRNTTTGYLQTDVEFCALQIRKILETIALSALVSDADVYREKLNKIETMWNARLILQDLERVHPDFYPQPIYIDPRNMYNWLDVKEDYLTKDMFVKIYEKCGKMLHESSPFSNIKTVESECTKFWNNIPQWKKIIIALLNTHIIKMYNQTDLFYIVMKDTKTGEPAGNIFSEVTKENTDGAYKI